MLAPLGRWQYLREEVGLILVRRPVTEMPISIIEELTAPQFWQREVPIPIGDSLRQGDANCSLVVDTAGCP